MLSCLLLLLVLERVERALPGSFSQLAEFQQAKYRQSTAKKQLASARRGCNQVFFFFLLPFLLKADPKQRQPTPCLSPPSNYMHLVSSGVPRFLSLVKFLFFLPPFLSLKKTKRYIRRVVVFNWETSSNSSSSRKMSSKEDGTKKHKPGPTKKTLAQSFGSICRSFCADISLSPPSPSCFSTSLVLKFIYKLPPLLLVFYYYYSMMSPRMHAHAFLLIGHAFNTRFSLHRIGWERNGKELRGREGM